MMKKTLIKVACLLFVLLVMPLSSCGDTWTDSATGITWTYVVSDGKASVGAADSSTAVSTSTAGAITIPSTLGGCPVSSVGRYAFHSCSELTSVTIPEGVTSIGNDAFSYCGELTSVTIPSSVTSIGKWAFRGCKVLTSVTIPEGVTSIENYTFSECRGLTSVAIPEGVAYIGEDAFYGCSGLTSMTIPIGVTCVGNNAFRSCSGLTSVTIPSSVASIGAYAFKGCSKLGDGVVIVDNCLLTVNGTCPASVVLPSGMRLIGGGAFSDCSGLTGVTIPSSVTSIGNSAFYGCSGLTSVMIPSSVTNIGSSAFSGCSGLTSFVVDEENPNYRSKNGLLLTKNEVMLVAGVNGDVTIPDGVRYIGGNSFSSCSGLKSVTMPSSVTNIGEGAFSGCSGLTGVTIPSSVTSIGNFAFYGCSGLKSVTIPEGVLIIGAYAFSYCGGLKSVSIPSSATSIEPWAFLDCSGLTGAVTMPEGVTSIVAGVFQGCSGLTSVKIPSSVTYIGIQAFVGCSGFASVEIPSSVTIIDRFAFSGCSGLTSVEIPSSVTNIGPVAFSDCSGLTNIVFGGNAPVVGSSAFSGVANGCTATVYTGTTGWDDDGDGKWQGLTLKYVDRSIVFTATGHEGRYDGMGHGITVSVTEPAEGATVMYSLTEDGEYAAVPILFTNVTDGAQHVYYKITADGYAIVKNWESIIITQGDIGGEGGAEPGMGEIPEGGLSKFDASYEYDGLGHTINTQALFAVTLPGATPSFCFSNEVEKIWMENAPVFTNVGKYAVWYRITAPNYKEYVHSAYVTITNKPVAVKSVVAQQRYPWNGLVDLSFTITGNCGMKYDTSFSVKDLSGGTNLLMKTLTDANGAALPLTNSLAPGSYRWIWNAAKDLPSGFVCDRVTVMANVVDKSLPSVTAGLIHYWPLNGVLNDVCNVGYRLTGTEPEWIMDKNGNDDNAAYLSGENILTQDGNNIGEDNFTISCWVKPEFVLSMPSWIGINLGPGNFGIDNRAFPILLLPASGTSDCSGVGFSVASDRIDVQAFASAAAGWEGDPCIILDAAVDLSSGWHHVAVAFSSGKAPVLYIDGVVKSASSVALGGRYYLSSKLSVGGGAFAYSSKYKGGLSELGIYNRALSADEVQRIYNESK